MNVIRVIKEMRDMKIFIHKAMLESVVKYRLQHYHRNIINLESSEESPASCDTDLKKVCEESGEVSRRKNNIMCGFKGPDIVYKIKNLKSIDQISAPSESSGDMPSS